MRSPFRIFGVVCVLHAVAGVSITNVTINPNVPLTEEQVWITCEAKEAAVLWWSRDGQNISSILVNNSTSRVEIAEASLNDTGNYSCHARGDEAEKQATETIFLTVESLPSYLAGNGAKVNSGSNATVLCKFMGYPEVSISWMKSGNSLEADERVTFETSSEPDRFAWLSRVEFKSVSKNDNGSYSCVGSNKQGSDASAVDLIVLDKPRIELDLIKGISPDSIFVNWTLDAGNAPMKHTTVRYKRPLDEKWEEVTVPGDEKYAIVSQLENGTAYVFQAGATNDVGEGEWTSISPEFSTLISDPFGSYVPTLVMSGSSKKSVSLNLEPPPSNARDYVGVYQLEAVDPEDPQKSRLEKIVAVMDSEKYSVVAWTDLQPGTEYVFTAWAVNAFTQQRGKASRPVKGATLDGTSSAPENVRVECKMDFGEPHLWVYWDPPQSIGGKIRNYQIRVMTSAMFNDEEGRGQHIIDEDTREAMGPDKHMIVGIPNTNYSVQVSAETNGGVGPWSLKSKESQCYMPVGLPFEVPPSKWRTLPHAEDPERRIFSLLPHRMSERNGPICCYRVVLVRMPLNVDTIPPVDNVTLMTYHNAHSISDSYGAYVAETFEPTPFPHEVILGDERLVGPSPMCKVCFSVDGHRHARSRKFATRSPPLRVRRRDRAFSVESLTTAVLNPEDGALDSNASYTGFIEIIVQRSDGQAAITRSPYFRMASDDHEVPSASSPGAAGSRLGAAEVVPIVLGMLLGIMVVAVLFGTLCVVRNYSKLVAAGQGMEPSFSFSVRHMWASLRGHPEGIPLSQPPPPDRSPIPKAKLVQAFMSRHKDGDVGFRSEFELLPERFADRTTKASDDLNNSGKNRYPDIKAYDQTRVTLRKTGTTEEHACSDYINANFVVGYKERKKFICAQGPLLGTVNDFWRMIWEYNVQMMIMLTNFEENRKVKCCWYWPEEGTDTYGDITVSCAAEKPYSDYVLRRLRAEKGEGETKETREVAHYHYLVWKDFMAPEHPSGVLKFLKRINSVYTPDKGHILIHCSAGVGRTGTLVALDSLLQELNEEGKVSVFNTVSDLRHQRNYLVQSLKQYIFVYRGLMEYAQFGDTEVAQADLKDKYKHMIRRPSIEFGSGKGISPMQEEFERLGEVVEDTKPITIATNEQNAAKNRSCDVVPFDQNRVILSPVFSRPDDTYVNASFIQGYDHSMQFIVMQDPLKSTRGDLWRLVLDHNVTCLVMLSECECEAELEAQEEDAMNPAVADLLCPQYWPDSVDTEETYDHIKVAMTKMDTLPVFIKRTFDVTNTKNGDNATVKQFQYLGWADSEYADPADKTVSTVPESTSGLHELLSQVVKCQESSPESGVIAVHCRHGGERSSVFVGLAILLQQLRTEGAVDVLQTVRNLKSQRPGMIQHLAQYEFLYKALVDYTESETA